MGGQLWLPALEMMTILPVSNLTIGKYVCMSVCIGVYRIHVW